MEQQAPSLMTNLIPIALIFGIFYFLIIRPQRKQEQERRKMLDAVDRGMKIITNGGLIGTVTALKGTELEIKIAENVKVNVLRSAVMTVVKDEVPAVH